MGWELTCEADETEAGGIRFRLVDIMLWTVAVAIPLGFFQLFAVSLGALLVDGAFALFFGLPILIAILGFRSMRFALAVPIALHCVLLSFYGIRTVDRYWSMVAAGVPVWNQMAMGIISGTAMIWVLTANLLVPRQQGYRWQRRAVR